MYTRLEELKKYQTENNIGNLPLANRIEIHPLTLKRVMNGEEISKRTQLIIDSFLNNPGEYLDIGKLLSHKKDNKISYLKLSQEIGISNKTLFNAIKEPKSISEPTRKLISNFLKKVC